MRDELLALLEDGPHEAAQLAEWLGARRIDVARALKAMAQDGLTKRVGVDKRWALASHISTLGRPRRRSAAPPSPSLPPPKEDQDDPPASEAEADEDLDAISDGEPVEDELVPLPTSGPPPRPVRVRPALRQPAPAQKTRRSSDGGRSWWEGLSREQLREEVSTRQQQMHDSRIARWVDGSVRD